MRLRGTIADDDNTGGSMRNWILLAGIAVPLLLISIAQADDAAINVTLSGEWTATAPDGTEVAYTFSKDGTLTWRVADPNFTGRWPKGLAARYRITVAKPLWEIDIFNFDEPSFKEIRLRGILEIVDSKTFKMDGQPSPRGERPKAFGKDALVFHARQQKESQKTPKSP
jgi:hypothetical protein